MPQNGTRSKQRRHLGSDRVEPLQDITVSNEQPEKSFPARPAHWLSLGWMGLLLSGQRLRALLAAPGWPQVLFTVFVVVGYIHLAGFAGTTLLTALIGWGPSRPVAPEYSNSLADYFVRWDAHYYLEIAQNGYRSAGPERAFFPLYPLTVRFLSQLLGLPLPWGGWLLSILSFVGACCLLYRWVLVDYRAEAAVWAVRWLCLFPLSFFFTAFYAEALFLVTALAGIYWARRGNFVASGLAIGLAGAARPIAFLLAVPYILEFWQQRHFSRSRWVSFGLGALLAPLGMLSYLLFVARQLGSWNIVMAYASIHDNEWHRTYTWPWVTLYDGINAALFGAGINPDWFSRAISWYDLFFALLGLLLAVWAFGRLRPGSALFLLAGVVLLYIDHGPSGYAFDSKARPLASLYPIYLILALWTLKLPGGYRWLPAATSLVMLGLLSAWFASGRWVS